jgi:hypothetical protein
MSLVNIQREYKDEYSALGKEEREELVREYKENIDGTKHLARPSPRGRIQDFSNTVRNLMMLVCDLLYFLRTLHDVGKINGLKACVGVEGFFCLVRNTSSYHIQPQWYFTCDGLEKYMKIATKKWSTHDVGTKVEAFAIAGCDPISKYILYILTI